MNRIKATAMTGRKYRRITIALGAAVGITVAPVPASAFWNDQLELYASETITSDDNVFRLSSAADPQLVVNEPAADDRYRTTELGMNLDLSVSRQQLVGVLAIEKVRFDRFSSLDLNGHSGRLAWNWIAGNRLSGRLGYSDSLILASLANIQAGEQNRSANFLTIRSGIADARYKMTERWHVSGSLTKLRHENSSDNNKISNVRKSIQELLLHYVARGGTEFGLSYSVINANLPNRQQLDQQFIDNSYSQYEYAATLDWPVTVDSRIQARAGRVSREHDELPARNLMDTVYELSYDWRATDKLTLSASARRGISPYEQVNVGFVFLESLTLRTRWRLTEKLLLTLSAVDGDRTYLGDPRLAISDQPPRAENLRVGEFGLRYDPVESLRLSLEMRRDKRTSSAELGDYEANILSFGVRIAF